MNNIEFWKATAIRCVRSFISVIMGCWTAGQLITEVDWKVTLLSAFSTTVYIFLACILAGLPEVQLADTLYDLDNIADEEYYNEVREMDDAEFYEEDK